MIVSCATNNQTFVAQKSKNTRLHMESKRVGTTPTKLDQDRMTLAVAIENPPIIDGLPIKTPLIVDFPATFDFPPEGAKKNP
jgi:hypothetical protein